MKPLNVILASSLLATAACSAPAHESKSGSDRGPVGKADLAGTCEGACGGAAAQGNCWCDDACVGHDDCCADKAAVCEPDAACGPQAPELGTLRQQVFAGAEEARHYLIHIPDSYQCDQPIPLVVDLHGTASDLPEEAYGLDALMALADREGFIAVRPRSRFSIEGERAIYRWDQNPGDIDKNLNYILELTSLVRGRYNIDSDAIYVTGFSTGTNMAAQFFGAAGATVRGIGLIGGGYWHDPGFQLAATAPLVYATTGYRDYLYGTLRDLENALAATGFPLTNVYVQHTDAGHDLYAWHYEAMWGWLGNASRPGDGPLAEAWERVNFPGSHADLLTIAAGPDGSIHVAGTDDAFWRRDPTGTWHSVDKPGSRADLTVTDMCFAQDGVGMATGEGVVYRSLDQGMTWQLGTTAPDFQESGFGYGHLVGIACGPDNIVGGGYWSGAQTNDAGLTWSARDMRAFGYAQQVAVGAAATGTVIAAGYFNYVGVSRDGAEFMQADVPTSHEWFNDVAAGSDGHWWVAGEAGVVLHSDDDGTSWREQSTPTDADLYSIRFVDNSLGVAAGAFGTVLVTCDGGETWSHSETGLVSYLGAVHFEDHQTVLVGGENGLLLRHRTQCPS